MFWDVKALIEPPRDSISDVNVLLFGYVLVPLKNICSKKCDIPTFVLSSFLEPTLQTTLINVIGEFFLDMHKVSISLDKV